MAVGSSFTGGSFRAGIDEVQEGTLGGAEGGSLKPPALLDADGGEGRRSTSRGGAWAAAWRRFFSLRFLLRRFWGLPLRFPRFWASGVTTTNRTAEAGVERAAKSVWNLRSSRARRSGFGRLKRRSETLTSDALIELYSLKETRKSLRRVARDPSAESTVVASQSPNPVDSPGIRRALGEGARRTSAKSTVMALKGPTPVDLPAVLLTPVEYGSRVRLKIYALHYATRHDTPLVGSSTILEAATGSGSEIGMDLDESLETSGFHRNAVLVTRARRRKELKETTGIKEELKL